MKTVHIIYNPTSGKGSTKDALDKIKAWATSQEDLNLVLHQTENVGHATIITKDLTSSTTPVTIFSLGGDGTLNEVLNGIENFETTQVGILPYGSGNDFVKALNYGNPDPVQLVDAYINRPHVMKCDYLLLNDKYRAINEVGLGMSAEVIAFRNSMKHFKPATQYKIATVVRALLWKKFNYTYSVDKGQPQQIDSMWFTMNNGFAVGGGLITTHQAKVNDGIMNVSYIKNFPRIATLSVLTKTKKGKIDQIKYHGEFACKEIDIETNNATVEYDGNLIENQNHVNVKIIPGKLNLLLPN